MTMSKRFGILVLVGAIGLIAFELGGRLSIPGVHSIVSTAQAVVGRPLTPVSVAGVARRTIAALRGGCLRLLRPLYLDDPQHRFGRPVHAGCGEQPDAQRDFPARRTGPDDPGRRRAAGHWPAVQRGTARRAGGVDRALPRRPADPTPDGLDVPARSCGGSALGGGPGTQVTVRRRVGEGLASRVVGSEREVPGAVPGRPGDLEQQSDRGCSSSVMRSRRSRPTCSPRCSAFDAWPKRTTNCSRRPSRS